MSQALSSREASAPAIQPLRDVQRQEISIQVVEDLASGAIVVEMVDEGGKEIHEIRVDEHSGLLVFRLKNSGAIENLALASAPLQFKSQAGPPGKPRSVPDSLRVNRDSDTRCSVFALNTLSQEDPEESFPFHVVLVVEGKVIGSPDPTIILDPPPCPPCQPGEGTGTP